MIRAQKYCISLLFRQMENNKTKHDGNNAYYSRNSNWNSIHFFSSKKRILTFHCIVFLLPLRCCIMIKTENKWCMVTTHIHQRKWSGTITLLCTLQQPPTHKYVVHSNLDLDKMLIFHLFTCVNIHFLHYIWEYNSVHYDLSCVGLFEMSSALENVKIVS